MPVSRSLARSRRQLSQRQENWFSMRPAEELRLDVLINPNIPQNIPEDANQDSAMSQQDISHSADI